MKLSLDALRVLDAIDRFGSYAAAAEKLFKVPSTLTYTMQKLEDDLGVPLFRKDGRRQALTPAGAELLKRGRELLDAAAQLEFRVKRIASGWESELTLAVEGVIPEDWVLDTIGEFQTTFPDAPTRLRLRAEHLSGAWDALLARRADLVVGAPGDGPAGGGYVSEVLGEVPFDFAVAPDHPLATCPEPLGEDELRPFPVIAVADTTRDLPARTYGILSGQHVLTVADQHQKRHAHRRGLGVGSLPRWLIADDVAHGRLVVRRTDPDAGVAVAHLAWRRDHKGKALHWFRERLLATWPL